VLDLYAGVGTFTLPLASGGGEVVAVESSKVAAEDLSRNLDRNGLEADVILGDAAEALEELGAFDLVVVDPPRSGLTKEVLAGLGRSRARRIAYVSCDPATLARDSAALGSAGYKAAFFAPLDMFPQTYHVETLAVFDAAQPQTS
jgi:23S rRNA (uracil1939-C5)-methyltransferase